MNTNLGQFHTYKSLSTVLRNQTTRILDWREQIKRKTMLLRRKQNHILTLAEKAGKVYMGTETLS